MGKLKTTEQDFQENFAQVLATISTGETVYYAMANNALDPSFLSWVMTDPSRKELYEKAQEVAAETLAHKRLELAQSSPDPDDMYMVKIRDTIYKELAEKWNPERYGPKKQVEQTVTVDIAAAIEAADKRVIELRPTDDD